MKRLYGPIVSVAALLTVLFLPSLAGALVTSSTTVNFPADGTVLKSGSLSSISCYEASKCVAVGNYNSDTDALLYPVVVRFDGSTAVSTKGSYTNGLGYSGNTGMTSVDCAPNSAGICWAVGNESFPKSNENFANAQSFIVRLTATAWEPTLVGTGSFPRSRLSKLSCWTATQCAVGGTLEDTGIGKAAVGFSDNGNATLTVLGLPEGVPDTTSLTFQDISCVSRTACLVVGRYYFGSEVKYFTSSFDGTRWVAQKLTLPSDALPQNVTFESAYAVRVSCTESAGCLIVGKYRGQYGYYYGFYGITSSVQGVIVTQKIADTTYIQETDKSYFQISDVDCAGSLSCFITTREKPLRFKNSVMAYAESGTTGLNDLNTIDCTDDSNCVGLLGAKTGLLAGVPTGFLGSLMILDFSKSSPTSTASTVAPSVPTTTASTVAPSVPTTTAITITPSSIVTRPAVTTSKSATAKSIAAFANLKMLSTSKVSLKVVASSAKFCKVSGSSLKGLKTGSCKVTVIVTPKKGKATSKTITLKVTK